MLMRHFLHTPHWARARCATRSARATLATLAALVVVVGTVASVGVAAAPPAGAANWAPVHSSDFPDPSTMEWLGVYYSFATQNFATPSQTINIQAATSLDGTNWTPGPVRLSCPMSRLGQARQHVGAERRERQCRQQLRHVLHGHGTSASCVKSIWYAYAETAATVSIAPTPQPSARCMSSLKPLNGTGNTS